jgi:gas vesicle protein
MYEQQNGQSNGTSTGTVVFALMCGAVAGATVALLFAPKPGAELRRQISETTDRMRRRMATTMTRAAGAVDDVVDRGAQAVERFEQFTGSSTRPDGGAGTSHG